MGTKGVSKFGIIAAGSLVVLALSSAPARAHQGHNYVAPLAALIAFGALYHHSHHNHRRHHGYRGGHGGRHGHKHHRRHSHSHGGYHSPRRKHHRNW